MANYTKTIQTALLSLQTVTASSGVTGTALDVPTALAAAVFIHFARKAATAAGAGANIRIEASSRASGEGHWYVVAPFTTQFAACTTTTVSGTEAAGQTAITLTSGTGFTAGEIIFFLNGTLANSEWHRIRSVSGATITLEDAIVNAQTSANVYDAAEMFVAQLDLSGIKRIRAVVDTGLFTQDCVVEIDIITTDSIG